MPPGPGAHAAVRNAGARVRVRCRGRCQRSAPMRRGRPAGRYARAARRRARPAGRCRRRPPASVSGSATHVAQPRVRRRQMRDRHRLDEEFLEARFDRGLDLLDPPHELLDHRARATVEQRDPRAGARGVAGGADAFERAVGNHAEHHRVLDVDMAAEGAGEPDAVDAFDLHPLHQQPHAGIERGLGELDRADVVLGDRERRAAVGTAVEIVGERPPVRRGCAHCATRGCRRSFRRGGSRRRGTARRSPR